MMASAHCLGSAFPGWAQLSTAFWLVASGCVGNCTAPTTEPVAAADLGWVSEIYADGSVFSTAIDPARDGWIAMHKHDYEGAFQAFDGQPLSQSRAAFALGLVHGDLASLASFVTERFFSQWQHRGPLPEGGEAPLTAALAAACGDDPAAGAAWAAVAASAGLNGPVVDALSQGTSVFEVASDGGFGPRLAIHRTARSSNDPAPLVRAAASPWMRREEVDFERRFWDPCVHSTLATIWLDRAGPDPAARWASDGTLQTRLFAPWTTTVELEAEQGVAGLLGADTAVFRPYALPIDGSDDADIAAEAVRRLNERLDATLAALQDAPTEGLDVIESLRLIHRLKQEWLITQARKALLADHPRQALRLMEVAQDHARSEIGVANAPALYVLLAHAQMRLGRTREALDAINVLARTMPEVKGLLETAGDLAVLEGLDRTGDSMEGQ